MKVFLIVLSILIALSVFSIVAVMKISALEDEGCKELGFEEQIYREHTPFCKDKEGDLYFIEVECDYYYYFIYPKACQVKEISVGNVRVIEK